MNKYKYKQTKEYVRSPEGHSRIDDVAFSSRKESWWLRERSGWNFFEWQLLFGILSYVDIAVIQNDYLN